MKMILSTVLFLGAILPTQGFLLNKPVISQSLGVGVCSRHQPTQLFANLWERMEIEEDEEPMWYLINCVAGLELDLLRQCLQVTEDMDDVLKIVVPMQRSTRSHGAKRMVTDVKVKYQGYVFAKLRLTEQTYLAIQGLDLCRSWMGTVNQKGYRKLPPAPLPLNEDEIENFGLEDIEELENEEEDEDGVIVDEEDKEEKLEREMEEVVQTVYKGLRVGDMVKVTAKNKFFDEDGIVRRLKDNKLFLRFYTYGTMFEEWLDPSDVRKLTDEEVLVGLGGPSKPITQRDIDGDDRSDRDNFGENRGDMRRNLYDRMGGGGQRNRRQDRNERRFSRGDSLQDQQQERKNWEWYQDNERKQRSGAYADGKTDIRGSDAAGDVDSQWGRGPQQAPHKKNKRNQQADSGDDWSAFVSNSNAPAKKQDTDDFFDSLYNDLSNELENEKSGGQRSDGGDDDFFGWLMDEIEDDAASESKAPKAEKPSEEDDFFASLEMELQEETPKKSKKKSAAPQEDLDDFFASIADFEDDNSAGNSGSASGDADDFFANLEADLETELSTTKSAAGASSEVADIGDDFFAELETELGAELQSNPAVVDSNTGVADIGDDFFAELESELGSEPTAAESKAEDVDDFFADLESDLGSDDFFADLEDAGDQILESEPEAPAPAVATVEAPAPASSQSLDPASLQKLTVPALKDMLRDRGLKVSGKKADLIERLVS